MPKKKLSDFNKIFGELEAINVWFQGENIDLGEALVKFKRGAALLKEAKSHIKKAENEFEKIKKEMEE